MAEYNQNLWAPWRMEYIRSLRVEVEEGGCFLCRYWSDPGRDTDNHVVWRTASAFVVMNRFPYTNGHLLIAHASHKADFGDLTEAELLEMTRLTRDAVEVLRRTLSPHGFNVGYNIGVCAGAGLPGHLHAHVVPRWSGDTNYMAVIGNSRVIPDGLDELHRELIKHAKAMGLVGQESR
jgi:ATP adenylyltransferase